MARAENTEIIERFEEFYRNYYRNEIGALAQKYPSEQRSLYVDWGDLYRFDPDLADDYRTKPDQMQEYAEEALRLYDLPVDVKLGRAHVRVENFGDVTEIRDIRARHRGQLIEVQGIVRKATDVRPKITEAAFECQRCGTLTHIPQQGGDFQEPHECQACERQGPFKINFDQSEFVDSQKLRVQESPEGLRGGETPQSIDVHIEDDITGEVTAGDHVRVTGVLHLDQQGSGREKSTVFDRYMAGVSVSIEDEQFEDMEITEEDKREIVELSSDPDIYEKMVGSVAPSIYGMEEEKLAIILQLFSGVTKHLPDESRIRGDMHVLLLGEPGTAKCVSGDTTVTLADGSEVSIRELVERHLDDPKPVDDGVYDEVDFEVPSLRSDGTLGLCRAARVWKREAPDRMYRIRTASGTELEVTPSHPLFVQSDGELTTAKPPDLREGRFIATARHVPTEHDGVAPDGGRTDVRRLQSPATPATDDVRWDRIESIETLEPDYSWVYDLEIEGTHNYLTNNVVSHNSQLLQYIRNIAPRSVYTSGKGSSAAGLTASAVRDDFGDGQQWTLEAGALVLADQGIAAVDELDKMRCVTGETLVQTARRGILPIRELARSAEPDGEVEEIDNGRTIRGTDMAVWTMDDEGKLVRRNVEAVHEYDAPDDLRRVALESGETLTATADHPFFVLDEGKRVEKPAAELDEGDWVFVPGRIPDTATDGGVVASAGIGAKSDSSDLSPAHGAILGYLAGDGNIYYNRGENYGIRFTNKETELLEHFRTACRDAFGKAPVTYPSERRDDGIETVRLNGKAYVDELLDAGANLETYEGKRLPAGVTRASRETKAAFVRALADSEGSVEDRNVKLVSSSYQLLLGVKMLLLEFGVTSQIQTCERDGKRDVYLLAITAKSSLEAFREHIGFTLTRKHRALQAACDAVSGDRTIIDVIPECGDLLERLRDTLRLYQSECGIDDATYCNFECGEANVSLRLAATILSRFEARKRQAGRDRETLTTACSWGQLETLRQQYHVSQAELAAGLSISQQTLSERWGDEIELREQVRVRLRDCLEEPSTADIEAFRRLVRSSVRWRRVKETREATPTAPEDDRVPILRHRITELLGGSDVSGGVQRARALLETEPEADTWEELRSVLERHAVSFQQLAAELDVSGSTVSRWFTGRVRVGNFDEVRAIAFELVEDKRGQLRELLDELEARSEPKVYDLTVEGTHNFIANGMVVHNSEDRSAMHEALEQQSVSISKAGINATLKSRCSLLGAANPKYGRFDQYEPIGEQIDLEPALISRFDLIFTVTDDPDEEKDRALAEHILKTNYAGELHTHREETSASNVSQQEVETVTEDVEPAIQADLLRKYIAHAKRNCYPTMTEEAKAAMQEFYVDLRARGEEEDTPVPVTARKLEALVRLSEASARVRLSDTVETEDAERVIDIVRSCLEDVGMDPETGEFDADVIEAGTSKSQRDRIKNIKTLIAEIEEEYEEGAPVSEVLDRAEEVGMERSKAEHEIEKLRRQGDVYEPTTDHLRSV